MSTALVAAEAPPELEELLRRCHRDELFPLARALRVSPSLGHAALARTLARTLRRRGANDLWNLLRRRGDGPPYPVVLAELAARHGLVPSADVEATELALLSLWVERAWDDLDPAERGALWEHLALVRPPPTSGVEAVAAARLQLGDRFGFAAGVMVFTGVARVAMLTPFGPLAGLAWLWWLARPRDEVLLAAVLEVSRLRQLVRHRVTIGVVGSPSSGKDAAIRALFGVDHGNVNPIAGSTREVQITQLPGATALFVVNTPGMGDVVQEVTEEARQVLDHIDVFVYVVNAQGGVQARELADWRACLARGRPVLAVVNKIDTLRPGDLDRYLADARQKLGAAPDQFLAAAFDPLPQLSDAPIGLREVQAWITRELTTLGKDPRELPWCRGAGPTG